VIAPDLPPHLILGDERQDGVVLSGAGELDLAPLRQRLQPLDDVLEAVLPEELAEDGVDVDGEFGVGVLLQHVQQGSVGLFDDLGQHLVDLEGWLIEVEKGRPVDDSHAYFLFELSDSCFFL
jgi:hypothetical protein